MSVLSALFRVHLRTMLRYVGSLPFCVFGKAASLPPNTRSGEKTKEKGLPIRFPYR
jgi:hypothetical protein